MVGKCRDQPRLQLRATVCFRKSIACCVEIVLHRAVELGPAGRAMSGQERVVVERLGVLKRGGPAVESVFADKDVDAVVDQVLGYR